MKFLKHLILFILCSCSTNIEVNSKFCQGNGRWISNDYNLERQNVLGEQTFENEETFVFAGVGVKELPYEELLEGLELKCSEIKTFRLTTYSTWFESILSFIPLFRFRTVSASGSFLKQDDADLVNNISKERDEKEDKNQDSLIDSEIPSAIMDSTGSEETEYSEDDFEE